MIEWEPTELYCPYCGERSVMADDCDDYYVGCTYHCVNPACDTTFHL